MKRFWGIALACLLALLPLTGAYAADAISTPEKFIRQIQSGSGLRMSFSLQASQAAPSSVSTAEWTQTRTLLNLISGTTSYLSRGGVTEVSLDALLAAQTLFNVDAVATNGLLALKSDNWGGQWLGVKTDDASVLDALSVAMGQWPSMGGVLANLLMTGDDAFEARAENVLEPYVSRMSAWLQGYGRTSIARDDQSRTLVVTTYALPMSAVVAQLKQMLAALYADQAALALINERLSTTQIAAWTQPSMLPTFSLMLDAMNMDGTVTLVQSQTLSREFSSFSCSLPLPAGNRLNVQSLDLTLDADNQWTIRARMYPRLENGETGAEIVLTADPMDGAAADGWTYTGTLICTPETIAEDQWTVGSAGTTEAVSGQTLAVDYSLSMVGGESVQASGDTQGDYEIQLILRPSASTDVKGEKMPISAQTLTFTAQTTTGKAKNSSIKATAALKWNELDSDASVTLQMDARTTMFWTPQTVNESQTVRLDLMEADTLTAYLQTIMERLTTIKLN